MPRCQHKYPNNMKDQAGIFQTNSTSPVEMFANLNYLGEPQGTEINRTIVNFNKELKNLKKTQKTNSMKLRKIT